MFAPDRPALFCMGLSSMPRGRLSIRRVVGPRGTACVMAAPAPQSVCGAAPDAEPLFVIDDGKLPDARGAVEAPLVRMVRPCICIDVLDALAFGGVLADSSSEWVEGLMPKPRIVMGTFLFDMQAGTRPAPSAPG